MMADEAEFAVPQTVEVIDDLVDAAPVVHADVGDVLARRANVVEDHWDVAVGEFLNQRRLHLGDHRGQAGDAPPDHQTDAGDQLFAAIVGVGDYDFEAGGMRVALHRLVDIEEKGILHIGDDHPDRPALSARQVAGVEIGMILQFLDCLDHSGTGGSLDHACIVQYPRDRGGGDLGAAGHLFEVHVPNIVQEIIRFTGPGTV